MVLPAALLPTLLGPRMFLGHLWTQIAVLGPLVDLICGASGAICGLESQCILRHFWARMAAEFGLFVD